MKGCRIQSGRLWGRKIQESVRGHKRRSLTFPSWGGAGPYPNIQVGTGSSKTLEVWLVAHFCEYCLRKFFTCSCQHCTTYSRNTSGRKWLPLLGDTGNPEFSICPRENMRKCKQGQRQDKINTVCRDLVSKGKQLGSGVPAVSAFMVPTTQVLARQISAATGVKSKPNQSLLSKDPGRSRRWGLVM